MRTSLKFLGAVLTGLVASSAQANLLINPSFEANSPFDWRNWGNGGSTTEITGWNVQTAPQSTAQNQYYAIRTNAVPKKDGNQYFVGGNPGIQTLASARPAAIAGNTYRLTLLERPEPNGNVWDNVRAYIDFYSDNTTYTSVLSSTSVELANLNWSSGTFRTEFNTFTINATAPVGTQYVGVRVSTNAGATPSNPAYSGAYKEINLDGFNLVNTTVPEPAAMTALVGVGMLALRRHRKA